MKNWKLNWLLLSALIVLSFGCNKDDDDGNGSPTTFLLESELLAFNGSYFLKVTNQHGEILLDTTNVDLMGTYELDVFSNDKIDVTYGYEFTVAGTANVNVKTFRNVASGFLASGGLENCTNEFGDPALFTPSNEAVLTVEGINASTVISGYIYQHDIEIDEPNNNIRIKGAVREGSNIMFTILDEASGNYKSYLMDYEDWTSGDTLKHTTHIDDFENSTIFSIDLNKDSKWQVWLDVINADGKKVDLMRLNSLNQFQTGEEIKFYTTSDVGLIDKLDLTINSTLAGDRYLYHKVLTGGVPSSIEFYDSDIDITHQTTNEYDFESSESYDFARIDYKYLNGNRIYTWSVYQLEGEQNSIHSLPAINSKFLDNAPALNTIINDPFELAVTLYETDESNIETLYNRRQLDLNCINNSGLTVLSSF